LFLNRFWWRPAYYDFTFPLNVFMHIMSQEFGQPTALHYGLFEEGEELLPAQHRATRLLCSRLPGPPAGLLDVGCGLGSSMALLRQQGYRVDGINPDAAQRGELQRRFPGLSVFGCRYEDFAPTAGYDLVYFQESAQYLDPIQLFGRAGGLAPRVLVMDEFARHPDDRLPELRAFVEGAGRAGFQLCEELDLSAQAAPTVAWFHNGLRRHRQQLLKRLALKPAELDGLERESVRVQECYRSGSYVYRLLDFRLAREV